jgi:prepilin-type N-terminal cleavage/methylation domain-containing protein
MIKGSVIYMKKMRNGKRGFTLLEIVTVVAIIVIIAGAAVVGVTVTLQRASATKAYLEDNNGRNFESEARNTVKNLTVNTVDWTPVPKYTPQNLAQKKWDELLAFGWTEEELGGELKYRDNGWYIEDCFEEGSGLHLVYELGLDIEDEEAFAAALEKALNELLDPLVANALRSFIHYFED